jgi:hypothetical protein
MKPRKYNNAPPARSEAVVPSSAQGSASPSVLNPADEVIILAAPPLPRLWLRVAFAIAPGSDPARAALAAAGFVSQLCALDKRLKMSVDQQRSAATAGELVLVFVLGRWGTLEAGWLEELKPRVGEIAFEGAELKSVEVVSGR